MNTYTAVELRTGLVTISPAQPPAATPALNVHRVAGLGPRAEPALPGANLSRFWELRGRRVFEVNGVLWGHYKGPFFSSLPFHLRLDASPEEVRSILRGGSIRGLRFPSANQPGLPSGLYAIRPSGYGLQSVNRKQRAHVTHGLEACELRHVDPYELLSEGIALNRDTLKRQSRQDATFLDPATWKRFVNAVGGTPGMAVHGAFIDGSLAVYLISYREGEWLHLMYKMSRSSALEHYPNHALDFSIIRDAASDPGIKFIGNGFSSVVPNEGLDRYKRNLGYEIARHNLCIHFDRTVARFLSNRATVSMARAARAAFPKAERLGYAATILEGARMSRPPRAAEPTAGEDLCQQEEALGFSRLLRPASMFPILRIFQTLRQGGIRYMVSRGADYIRRRATGKKNAAVKRPLTADEVLRLEPGEWVEVKSMDEIRATLDERSKNRGLLFTDDMRGFAGQRFRVFKRVESIFLEESKQRRTLKNTVLLDAAYCPGITFRCDRSCFLFWKEAWLRRIPPEESQPSPGKPGGE